METPQQHQTHPTDEDRYRLLIDGITDYAIYMLDTAGLITTWNAGAERLKGYDAAEILGQHFSVFYTDQDRRDDLPNQALKISAAKGRFEHEGWHVRKDGSRFWAAVVINPILDHTGQLIGFAKITRDLTARKAAEDALRRSEEQFRRLVQGVTDYAIFLLDPQGHVSSWNSGAQRIKGYLPTEIIGRHFSVFYTADDQQHGEPARALDVAVQNGKYEKEGWRVRKNGDVFWANVVIDPVYDDNGGLVGFAKVTRDMTDAKKAQMEVDRARESLLQSQKMEAVGQLTGGVAHDFNNLLTAILGGLEIIQRRLPTDANITPLLENAIQAALRGRALTQRMLAFARRQDLKPQVVEVSALVNGMTDLLQRTLGPLVAIQTDMPSGLDTIMADANHLELAILNLAMNARDATVDGGTITIAARTVDASGDRSGQHRYVCLSVTDDGTGMNATTLSRATEPFFTTKGVGKGTGLGLSMVHGFAEQSGGYLTLKSQPGMGTVAEIWLPVAPDSVRTSLETTGTTDQAEPLGQHTRVALAVDDDRLSLMNTASILNSLGYRVFTATSGKQALASIRQGQPPDLIVIDHAIPGMNGAELIEAIHADWPDLPVIFLTPLANDLVHSVAKPLQHGQLTAAIARTHQRTSAHHPP